MNTHPRSNSPGALRAESPNSDAVGHMTCSVDSPKRPTWRGWMHAAAFVVSIPASTLLILLADDATKKTSAAIYGTTLIAMFGLSAAYHRLARSEVARRRMQKVDHIGIYFLIAGTYVPFAVVVLPQTWGLPLLAVVASAAVFGAILKVAAFDKIWWLSYALYPIMGWAAVATAPVLIDSLTTFQLAFMVAGGVLYSIGIPVLFLQRPNPWPRTFGYHEIWHVFVTVAAASHFVAVASIVA